jgi:arylsulfatase A-like enzyme
MKGRSSSTIRANSPSFSCNAALPRSARTVAEVLRQHGYSTYCCGKWHLTPSAESAASGPFDRWPLGCGFERCYGFLPGETFSEQHSDWG